jgi:glycosyltransferase involved in cell wall biosynthesis
MEIYADQLLGGIRALLNESEEISDCLISDVRLRPGLARYIDQYIRYQLFSRSSKGDINHVIDHGYGHLLHTLPPEKSIVTFHDSTVTKVKGVSIGTRMSLRYSLSAIRKAARVIADSENSRKDFLEQVDYPHNQISVVYPGIDTSFCIVEDRQRLRRELNLPDYFVLNVGHTLPYMNVENALRAFALFCKHHPSDIKFVKVGNAFTGEQKTLIERLKINDRMVYLGQVPFQHLPAIYNCADVLIYIPLYAGFGLPPLESMACGTPVVCSNRGSLPEVVEDAALICDPDDVECLANHLEKLLAYNSVREELINRGQKRARQFSWANTAKEVLKIYREVACA